MLENLIAEIAGFFFWLLNISINKTVRFKIINKEIVNKSHLEGKYIVFAGWHGQFFPFTYYFRNSKMCILPITSFRGKILLCLARKYGYRIIPYPESGTPGERIQSAQRTLTAIKEGFDLSLAVDGPPKPEYHKVNPGVLFFSQKANSPLVPIGIYMKKKITLFWRWDKYEIPLPFSEVVIALGEPIFAPDGMGVTELEKKTKELEKILNRTGEIAKQAASKL